MLFFDEAGQPALLLEQTGQGGLVLVGLLGDGFGPGVDVLAGDEGVGHVGVSVAASMQAKRRCKAG